MMKILIFLILIEMVLLKNGEVSSASIDFNSYANLPPMYDFESYDECLDFVSVSGTYCMVYAEIVPNNQSSLWPIIDRFSKDRRHYRHDHLFFGVCIERCQRILDSIDVKDQLMQLERQPVEDQELVAHYARVHHRPGDEELRAKHSDLVHLCLNYKFRKEYNLELRTSIEYCEITNQGLNHDIFDYTAYVVFLGIFLLCAFSSLIDFHLKLQQPIDERNNNFYKKDLDTTAYRFLTLFSICRNYYRITGPHSTEMSEELKFIDCYRVFGVLMVNFGHILMIVISMPLFNPEFIEQFFYRNETALLENGSGIIQIFFVISSFLLYVNFFDRKIVSPKTKWSKCIGIYFKLFIYRYLRLVPSLGAFLLFTGSLLGRLQDGPFWRHMTEAERVFCRENGWKNLLFVNNFMLHESCAIQTWYVAADVQLFAIFLVVAIIVAKKPRFRYVLYGLLFGLSIVIPALITYLMKLDPVYHLYPENYRYLLFKDPDTFFQSYIPFYTNMGGYLVGFCAGDIYFTYKDQLKTDLTKYSLTWWLVFPIGLAWVFTGTIFMSYEFEKPSIFLALYGGFFKNILALICAIALLGMCFKMGWFVFQFTRLSMFRPLSRISYQTYLWHMMIVHLFYGFYRTPVFLNRLVMLSFCIVAIMVSNHIAFLMALIVEYPFGEFFKLLFRKIREKTQENTPSENAVRRNGEIFKTLE